MNEKFNSHVSNSMCTVKKHVSDYEGGIDPQLEVFEVNETFFISEELLSYLDWYNLSVRLSLNQAHDHKDKSLVTKRVSFEYNKGILTSSMIIQNSL